jgi:hypothetical protein
MAWRGGLSIRPSAQVQEVSTPELWLGNRSSPPLGVDPDTQELAAPVALGQSKSALHARARAAAP